MDDGAGYEGGGLGGLAKISHIDYGGGGGDWEMTSY